MGIREACLLLICLCGVANAQVEITKAGQDTGTILKKDLKWSSKIPVDKTYEQLTPEQRAELRSLYSSLGPDDEPPFPLEGRSRIMAASTTNR